MLFTEIYLDWYFRDERSLLASLNEFVQASAKPAPATKAKGKKAPAPVEVEPFGKDELNKLAFWMATGSGKTLLMHCHIRQYVHYLRKAGKSQELNRIILLTPNEGLSRQHEEEFELSGIEAALYDKSGSSLPFTGRGVDIIDIHKLRETTGDKTIAVDTFEGNNLVLVDEGHRGSGGEEWMDKRARLCANGFSFEYSATFGQAIKAAGTVTAPKEGKKPSNAYKLTQTYAKSILFDYSYKFFYNDGYGKDFNILNLAEEHEEETQPLYLTACLLAFYEQCNRFADGGAQLVPYLLESPLMIFVGGSVSGQRQTQEDTDLVQILKFLADFIHNRAETERRIAKLLRRQDDLMVGGRRVFAGLFQYIEGQWQPEQASELFSDIMQRVFNAPGGGQLHIVRLQGADGEIGLRVGNHEWFGVVNVGEAKKLCDLCAEKRGDDDHYVVDDQAFSGSLFGRIKEDRSPIRLLAGAKKFTEGWSSWRVSAMGLMNVGKKEGSEIIQLFGRGVRLKGYRFKLKRTSALDALDFEDERSQQKHPAHIELLETLNIFGIKSDYMKEFQDYLEEEGVGEEEQRELVELPTIRLPEFEKAKLNIILPKKEMPDFKKTVRLQLASLEEQMRARVTADWYPRLQKQSSVGGASNTALASLNIEPLRQEHLAFLNWDSLWFEVERYKRDKAYYNIVFSPADLKALLNQRWWYDLFIPSGYLDFRFDRLPMWQEIATYLLKGYLERFFQFEKRKFEEPYLEYQELKPTDDLLLKQYQLLVKKSERELIKRLKALGEKFRQGEFEEFSFENFFQIFKADHHLYHPLVHLGRSNGGEAVIKVVPTHLNEGEKQFVDDLESFCKTEVAGLLEGFELYLLRNHSSSKAVSFFTESDFRPDFILWLVRDNQQTIAFIDPKGLRNFTDNFRNPKIQLARKIKALETRLNRPEIRLESYLISQTHRHQLRWPSPSDTSRGATPTEFKEHHILLAKDEPDTYVQELFLALTSQPQGGLR